MGAGQWLSYGPSEFHKVAITILRHKSLTFVPDIAKATVAADRIIDMRSKDQQDGRLISLDFGNIGDDDMGVKIQFQNVWFRYPTRDVPILNGLNLTVSACWVDPKFPPDVTRRERRGYILCWLKCD